MIAQQGIGLLAARMGKVPLGATVVLWIAWFFMPVLTVAQTGTSRAITFWDFLALDLSNEVAPLQLVLSSHGLLSIIGLAFIAAPFVRQPRAKFLYAMPLAYLILVAVAVLWNFNHAIGEAADIAKRTITYVPQNPRWNEMQARSMQGVADRLEQSLLNSISIGYGAFAIVVASLFLAVCVFNRRASDNAGNAVKPPSGGVSFIANWFLYDLRRASERRRTILHRMRSSTRVRSWSVMGKQSNSSETWLSEQDIDAPQEIHDGPTGNVGGPSRSFGSRPDAYTSIWRWPVEHSHSHRPNDRTVPIADGHDSECRQQRQARQL